ncbi:MAG: alkaline phosphatase family protein, partial [Brachybacterium sp.]|uniref:alkaline phosphatase family protein n=1 Tax=Brachybacterium sp. TaxID=1891286 RepID=UPI0026479120
MADQGPTPDPGSASSPGRAPERGGEPAADWPSDLLPPPFAGGARPGQLDVIEPLLAAPEPGRDLVVVLDGVGSDLLIEHRSLTPTLRRLEGDTTRVRTVFPSTTATAMVSLHTGLPPLVHGVLGYLTADPDSGRAVNQLTGDPAVDPRRWMPETTPVERRGPPPRPGGPPPPAGAPPNGG